MSNEKTEQDSQALMNQMILDYMRDQRNRRRWRWLLRIIFLLIIVSLFFKANQMDLNKKTTAYLNPHVGLIDISGEISSGTEGSSDAFAKSMKKAYDNENMKALILRINSNGGSPVQAEYMYSMIQDYRKHYPNIKVYAVCVDACLSAAYYIAAAADDIYASPSSMVGSIGVLYNGFGFVGTLDKLGMSRRLQTAGSNKGFLDPFSPETGMQKQELQTMLDLIHQQFIERVKEGRGSRLHQDSNTFSGLFWTGKQALGIGLIDGFASSRELANKTLKMKYTIDYTYKDDFFERFSKNIGMSAARELPAAFGLKSEIR